MKKILVPCDFSTPAIQAFRFAMDMACASQGEVIVLKVIDLPFLYESAFGMQPAWHDPSLTLELEQRYRGYYERMKNMYADLPAPVSLMIEHGSVKLTILRIIEEQQVDLVVMGTHGAGGAENLFMGTNTERIVRLSPVPVITLRNASELSAIRTIVFPVTLEMDDEVLVAGVRKLQQFFHARLHVLLISTPDKDKASIEILENFAKHHELVDYTLAVRNEENLQEGIFNYAAEVEADMLAMGTHGRKGIRHVIHGSITEDIINQISCPVWTFNISQHLTEQLPKSKRLNPEKATH